MKNKIKYVLILIAATLLLSACGKKAGLNENGTFRSLNDAAEAAKKSKQNVLLIVTTGEDDLVSSSFVTNVLNAPDFKKEIASKYAVVNFDFSEASYQKTVVKEDATSEEQKAAEDYANVMYDNARVASLLNVQAAPAIYLFTKEKYFIAEVEYEYDCENVADFKDLLSVYDEKAQSINLMIKETETGSVEKRVTAIDTLFESTEAVHRAFLGDLIDTVVELDKNNSTGLLSKYLVAQANTKASDLFMAGNVPDAVLCFVNTAKKQEVEPEHKQQMYYMAAYLLAMSGSDDYTTMLEYLSLAIAIAPESENVEGINIFKSYIEAYTAQ